jgi:hypothetical protein
VGDIVVVNALRDMHDVLEWVAENRYTVAKHYGRPPPPR